MLLLESPPGATGRATAAGILFLALNSFARGAEGATDPPVSSSLMERIHTHVSSELGLFANAYLIETAEGIVAVDATLTVSDATAFRERLVSLGRPLVAVLLTHGHPDHYNGLTELVSEGAVPIIATAGVDRIIREWDGPKEAQWKPIFKDEWPTRRTFPNRVIQGGESVSFGGVRFTAHDIGPGESHHDAYWIAEDATSRVAFVGDLAFNGAHAYVSDGHTGSWLENLESVADALEDVARIYPGHGRSGGLELFDRQRRYLLRYRDTIRALGRGRSSLTDVEKQELTEVMTTFLPNGRLTFLIGHGADAVATELANEK